MAKQYHKKPVVVEAVQVQTAIRAARLCWEDLPWWLRVAYDKGEVLFLTDAVEITTLEGTMRGELSDYLIKGVKGEIYPCKPDIFAATYDEL